MFRFYSDEIKSEGKDNSSKVKTIQRADRKKEEKKQSKSREKQKHFKKLIKWNNLKWHPFSIVISEAVPIYKTCFSFDFMLKEQPLKRSFYFTNRLKKLKC